MSNSANSFKRSPPIFLKWKMAVIRCLILSKKEYIKNGNIDIAEWSKVANVIFRQMIDCIAYIHSKHVVHFDISLENWLINDVDVEIDRYIDGREKIRFVTSSIKIKLCDFGLAQRFTNKSAYRSNKFCGKQHYKSPEITHCKKNFDAAMNDVWSLGICAFVLYTGCFPFLCAHKSDNDFLFVFKHGIGELLRGWKMEKYVCSNLICLLDTIFKFEEDRVSLDRIEKFCKQFVFTTQ